MPSQHVLIAVENEPYPHDVRVRQEAETLRDAGYAVTVCAPTGHGFERREEEIDGVDVRRFPAPPDAAGAVGYLGEYAHALFWLARSMQRVARRKPVDAVIVCAPPDLMVLPPLWLRRRPQAALVFDHHDLSPELFEAKFGRRGPLHSVLERVEGFALRSADVVISTNDTYAEIARERGRVEHHRVFVVRNAPDPGRIYPVPPAPELKGGHEHLICRVGAIGEQEGLEHLLAAADELVHRRARDIQVAIVGPGDASALQAEVGRLGLTDHVAFPGRVSDELLRQYMATADVCVDVEEANPFSDASTMTKVSEYMLMARPIVQFPLRETRRVSGEASLYARSGDSLDLADRIEQLLDDPARAAALGAAARERILAGLLWSHQAPVLLEAVATALRLRRS